MKKYSIIQRHKSRGVMTWYGRISENGIVKYVSLATERKSDALEWLNKMNAEKFLPESLRGERTDRKIDLSILAFLNSIETAHGADSSTWKAYYSRLGVFQKWAHENGILSLRAFSKESAQKYADFIVKKYAPKTARESIRICKQFCAFCADTYEMDSFNPFKRVKSPKLIKRQKDFWTIPQIEAILDAAPSKEFRLFWALMAYAGLRHSEAVSVDSHSIFAGKLHVIGKGNKEAFLPISKRLNAELERFGEIPDKLFTAYQFRHSKSNITLRKAVKCSGIIANGVTSNHRFRHSFASNLIRAGVNIKAVQQLMRHEDIRITLDTYSHLLQEDLSDAVNTI